ncbi:hypothetical protein MRB53_036953 [Persea americana]|nr:hypothetical protein MRB53_036953 [Persea americana]
MATPQPAYLIFQCHPRMLSRSPHSRSYKSKQTFRAAISVIHARYLSDASLSTASSLKPRVSYKIAASYSAKLHRYRSEINIFTYDSATRSQLLAGKAVSAADARATFQQSGQDAFFVSAVGDSDAVALGVADGVGGWTDSGVDPGLFSHGLCNNMAAYASAYPSHVATSKTSSSQDIDVNTLSQSSSLLPPSPLALLKHAYTRIITDPRIPGGGTTACLAVLDSHGTMSAANLGDSGFAIFRPARLSASQGDFFAESYPDQPGTNAVKPHHIAPFQTHAFNTPFQLSRTPAKMLAQIELYGGGQPLSDLPSAADLSNHTLQAGDVVVFATDGVWDNVDAHDTATLLDDTAATFDTTPPGHALHDGTARTDHAVDSPNQEHAQADRQDLELDLAMAQVTTLVRMAKRHSLDRRRDGPFALATRKFSFRERWTGGKPDDICVVLVRNSSPTTSADASVQSVEAHRASARSSMRDNAYPCRAYDMIQGFLRRRKPLTSEKEQRRRSEQSLWRGKSRSHGHTRHRDAQEHINTSVAMANMLHQTNRMFPPVDCRTPDHLESSIRIFSVSLAKQDIAGIEDEYNLGPRFPRTFKSGRGSATSRKLLLKSRAWWTGSAD